MQRFVARSARPPAAIRAWRAPKMAAALVIPLLLSACGAQFKLPCPPVNVLGQAREVVKFAPGANPEPANVRFRGEVTEAKLRCQYDMDSLEEMEVALGVAMVAERGPANRDGVAVLDYFVAILDRRGNVIAKEVFNTELRFENGRATAGTIEEIYQKIPLVYPQNGGSFEVWVGFQLSRDEIEFIRARRGV